MELKWKNLEKKSEKMNLKVNSMYFTVEINALLQHLSERETSLT